MSDLDRLHSRLQKLLRLADDGSGATEAERDLAMERAQEIAFQHNIVLEDFNLDPSTRARVTESGGIDLEEWEGELLGVVARVNFCRTFYYTRYRSKERRYVIYGKEHNIVATRDLFWYLREQLQREGHYEIARRDKRMQYARMVLIELAVELAQTRYMKRLVGIEEDERLSPLAIHKRETQDKMVDAAASYLQGNDHLLKGADGLFWIMQRTGLTASYASEIRPYLRRGEYAPEIVRNMGPWKYSFFRAAVWHIQTRLNEKYKDLVDQAGAPGTALVKSEKFDLDAYQESLNLTSGSASNRQWDFAGASAGRDAGSRVNLEERSTLQSNVKEIESGK